MSITRMSPRIAVFTLCTLLGSCSSPESASPPRSQSPVSSQATTQSLAPVLAAESSTAELLKIRFDTLSSERGLTLSITAVGDSDGKTTLANKKCCGIEDAQQFVRDVRIHASGRPLPVAHDASGWTVSHAPQAILTVTYRLPPSGPTRIDTGVPGQIRPLIHGGLFHLIGNQAFLLPAGRAGSDPVELDIDATRVAGDDRFVSSFGPGTTLRGKLVTRAQVGQALYLGGPITLTVHDTPAGKVGVVYSAMDATVRADDLRNDALAIVAAERGFFDDAQPWYLVSVHGAARGNSKINIGGGTGLTDSFVMFVATDLDFSNAEHREHFRWVLAHEYFHQWNGLTLRVAPRPKSEKDDTSVYWFSEGVTEFYTMRLLTRAGLQLSARSLDVLNNKLMRYAKNGKRGVSAEAAGGLFWTDADGEQIPYLRGYLVAWHADIAMRRSSDGKRGLDAAMQALVKRAKAEPHFRVDNAFLASYLTAGLAARDAKYLRKFMIDGGEAPLDARSFSPCLEGKRELISGHATLQFDFADVADTSCFHH